MNKQKNIMILANKYPNKIEPTTNTFIQQLASEFADLGCSVTVVCPMPINFNYKYIKLKKNTVELTENGNSINVIRPKYISFGQSFNFFQKLRVKLTTHNYYSKVKKILNKLETRPDYIYSYFICPTSVAASKITKKYGIPSFMECGEAKYSGDSKYGNANLKKKLADLTGVIAVSNQNKNFLVNNGVINKERIVVYPNCFRKERFYMMDRAKARKKFGWPEDRFIVGMAGSFDERKGVLRLQEAVDKLDDVYFACAGKGSLTPSSEKCLLAKPVAHDELVYFYNALDVYVLPTLAEGSCTATAEAIGCGCPIISSDREFNESLCFSDNSIVIDPTNIEQISDAINKVHCDKKLQQSMAEGSLKHAKDLQQRERMQKVLQFMETKSK